MSGGGGSSGVKYANLEKLYGTQQQAAQFMLDQAMPRLPGALDNSQDMVDEAMSGKLATRTRNQAGADASQAFSNNMAGVNRNLQRFGSEFNPNALRQQQGANAVENAATRAGAMNKATQWAEDQKWNRNSGMFAQVTGTGSGAMQGMSSAGAGLSNIAGLQANADMANAHGYGSFGSALGYGMMKADGGLIESPKKGHGLKSVRLSGGGDAWEAYKRANPVMVSGRNGGRGINPALAVVAGAAPHVIGAGLKDVMKNGKDGVVGKALSNTAKLLGANSAPVAQAANVDAIAAPVADTMGGIDQVASFAADGAGIATLGDSVAPAAEAFGEAANSDLIADAAQTWGGAMSSFKDGGAVCKKSHGLRLARGGGVFKALPSMASMDASSSMTMPTVARLDDAPKKLPSTGQQSVAAQSPVSVGDGIRGAKIGSDAAKSAEAADKAKDAAGAASGAASAAEAGAEAVQAGEAVADTAGKAADSTGSAVPYGSFIKAGADLLSGRNPGEAVADAALGYGGAQAGAAIGSAAGPVGTVVGGMIGGLLGGSFFADGGEPGQREDFTPGGDVRGPGTETSDSIPAWLSNGEIVENAEAVKLAGKDALLAINQAGRDVREGNASPQEAAKEIGQVMIERGKQLAGGVKLADGGDAERLMREMESKYGVSGRAQPEAQPQQPMQKVSDPAKELSMADRLRRFATGNLDGRVKAAGLKRGGEVKLAGGGLLGVSLGAGVNQWNRQQMIDQQQQQIDLQKQNAERQGKIFERQEKEWADQDALKQDIQSAVSAGQEKAASGYIDQAEADAKASAEKSGEIWAGPLTQEQRKVIASAPGLHKITPHIEYETNLGIADAYRRKGDLQRAEALSAAAEKKAAGHAVNAILGRDGKALRSIYNVFPNGDTPDDISFDKDGNMAVKRGDNIENVKASKALLFALSRHDPEGVAKMFQNGELTEEKINQMAENMRQRMDLGLARLELKQGAGNGNGKGKGAADANGELYLDRKKFNDAYGFDNTNADEGDIAHAFYSDLYATARKGGQVSEATNAKLAMQAKQMAKGKLLPVVDFDGSTMDFRYGIKDAQGNTRYLQSGAVDGLRTKDTMTGKPFYDEKQISEKERAGLQAFANRDPEGFRQAAELLADPKRMAAATEAAKSDRSVLQVVNAANLIAKYRDAKPDDAPKAKAGESDYKPFGSNNPDYEYSAARDRVQRNSKPGHIPGLVDTIGEWLNPKLIGK